MNELLFQVSVWLIPTLLAITLHEAAHGYVAWQLGDDTAWRLGRVSFNPLRHIDPFGTVLLPALLLFASGGRLMFGYAKPVPVDFRRLNQPRRDMVLVAAAGPGINIVMAIVASVLLGILPTPSGAFGQWLGINLYNALWINVLLAVFNMLPLPPLDGGRVAVGLLPRPLALPLARLERFGMIILLAMIFLLPMAGKALHINLNLFEWLVIDPADWLSQVILDLFGGGR